MIEESIDVDREFADIEPDVAHFYKNDVPVSLCGIPSEDDAHSHRCPTTTVNLFVTAFCPICGAPICAYCRLLVPGMPT